MVLGVSPAEYRRHGAFAEYVAVPEHILYELPENVSFDQAAMVEPFAVAAHAIELTPVALQDTAVVVGSGMIGLCIIQLLRARGAGQIVAVDPDSERLRMAETMGADIAIHPEAESLQQQILDVSHGRGSDVVFEAVGISQTVNMAIQLARRGGSVTLVGNLSPHAELPLQAVVTRQIRLQGSCAICGEYPLILAMMARKQLNVDALLSATAPLRDGAEWFKKLYNHEKGLMKVILKP
jgi:L-iditol 2-dehydrogenase